MVYLAGMGRSGSTLLDRLLGQLDGWWSLGELVHLWQRGLVSDERCGCGQGFSSCPVWVPIGARAFGGWDRVNVDAMQRLQASVERDRFTLQLLRPDLDPGFERRLQRWNDVVTRIYRAAAEVTGARVLVDSSKHTSTLLARRHLENVDVLPVHLVRDSRGVAYSWTKAVARPATDGRERMTRWSPLETGLRYSGYNLLLASVLGRDRVVVRYEDLVDDPGGVVARVAARRQPEPVEVPVETTANGHAVRFEPSHGLSGNPMRASTGETVIRRDDQWLTRLPRAQRELVTTLTFPSLVGNGYPLRPWKNHQAQHPTWADR